MEKLSNLNFNDMKVLIETLKNRATEEDLEAVPREAENFFPKLTALQEVEFILLCETILKEDFEEGEHLFNIFKENYPDVEVDPTGTSVPSKKEYWELGLYSLELAYKSAYENLKKNNFRDTSPSKIESQIYNAKTLQVLVNRGKERIAYPVNKAFLLKNTHCALFTKESLEAAENTLKNIGFSFESLNRLIGYINKKQISAYYYFAKNFLARLSYLDKDPELKNPANKEFYENLKKIEI